ncbi:MAG TPA: glycogen/starch synthase, partial [Cellvibrio sp.]
MQKILFATSEVHPLIKTGGLADVAASLPRALLKLGHDVKIILPAYASVMQKLT